MNDELKIANALVFRQGLIEKTNFSGRGYLKKQTQFSKGQNERKYLFERAL